MSNETPFIRGIKFLQANALFGGFTEKDLEAVLPLMEEESFKEGDYIIREGETGDRLHFIEKGRVEVTKDTKDGETLLTTLGPGDEFGEMELIDIRPRSATVRAVEEVVTLSLTNRNLLRLYHNDVEIFARLVLNLAREVSRRFRKAEERWFGDEEAT